jgi:hypothetical protein
MISNIKEAQTLNKKYRAILKANDIAGGSFSSYLEDKTGFGKIGSCILCQPLRKKDEVNCTECIWSLDFKDMTVKDGMYCLNGNYSLLSHCTDLTEFKELLKWRINKLSKLIKLAKEIV